MWYRPKHIKPNKPHFSAWIMRIAAIIGCLIIISAYLLSGVYARFSTTVSGSDSARVARFNVSAFSLEGQENNFTLSTDNAAATYHFTVTSDSEVAVEYDVILELPYDDLPAGITFTIDGNEHTSVNGLKYIFSNAGQFTADGGTNAHTLQVVVSSFNETTTLNGIVAKVVARQLD